MTHASAAFAFSKRNKLTFTSLFNAVLLKGLWRRISIMTNHHPYIIPWHHACWVENHEIKNILKNVSNKREVSIGNQQRLNKPLFVIAGFEFVRFAAEFSIVLVKDQLSYTELKWAILILRPNFPNHWEGSEVADVWRDNNLNRTSNLRRTSHNAEPEKRNQLDEFLWKWQPCW